MLTGCQGRDKTPTISEKICPSCGEELEIFSNESESKCPKCGFVIYNDIVDCVQWCKYAKLCVGPENYDNVMKAVAARKEREASGN